MLIKTYCQMSEIYSLKTYFLHSWPLFDLFVLQRGRFFAVYIYFKETV